MEKSRVVGLSKIAYNETMTAFARSSRQDASAYIERIYDRLLRAYDMTRRKDFKPDKFTYFSGKSSSRIAGLVVYRLASLQSYVQSSRHTRRPATLTIRL